MSPKHANAGAASMGAEYTFNAGVKTNPRAAARLIGYARDRWVALPPHTTVELLEGPEVVLVPGAPYYAHGLVGWRDSWLPLIDLETLLRAYAVKRLTAAPRYALVVAYQLGPGLPVEFGAIALEKRPQTIVVGDEANSDLPIDSDLWKFLAISCIHYKEHIVPVLDTARLFCAYHG